MALRRREIPLYEAQNLLPDKKSYYKAMIRNNFYVPNYKSSLCCVKWMKRVRSGKYWCPKKKDIHPFSCADPPKKAEILEQLIGFATDKGKNLGISEKRQPDKQWALQMLAVLKPDHVYFRKDFVPKREIDRVMIDNQDDFLTGLPPGKWRKRKGGIFKEPEENRLKRNLATYERRLARGKERLIELANEKDSDSEVSEGDSSDEDNQIRPK